MSRLYYVHWRRSTTNSIPTIEERDSVLSSPQISMREPRSPVDDPDSNHLDFPLPTAGPGVHSTVGHEHALDTIVKRIALGATEGPSIYYIQCRRQLSPAAKTRVKARRVSNRKTWTSSSCCSRKDIVHLSHVSH